MTVTLSCHPATPPFAVDDIEASIELSPEGQLWVRYNVLCDMDTLVIPDPEDPDRTDGLWQSTCFEVFLRRHGEQGYFEYNFSPSGQWAAYAFDGYRSKPSDLPITGTMRISLEGGETHFALEAELELPEGWLFGPLDINITAVIEEEGGTKSYWALMHSPAKPDFHDGDCFVLALKAGEGA